MPLNIYNSKSGRKDELRLLEEGHIKMYVCGITAYDYCHIGHARSALVFDMIVRYFRYRGYKVTYVRNFTDIDDKIIKRAQEQNTSTEELSERFIAAFYEDMNRLGVGRPTVEPRATDHMDEMIQMIQELLDKGLAYQMGDDVYYAVENFKNYGALSGRSLDEMKAGARISVNENKINPMDFVLWKGSKPGEPTWNSPWGPGRPGWHLECSAMSRKYLGDTFDIHGGGQDLIFPHHENEIAQSEGATGVPFVNHWIHHGFVTIKDEKMSKSLGNFLTIREVLDKFSPEALRLFVFSTHYRNPLDYSEAAMQDVVAGLDRLYECLAEIALLPPAGPAAAQQGLTSVATAAEVQKLESLATRYQEVMDNDFNTAQALGHLFDAVKTLNKIKQALPARPADRDLDLLHDSARAIKTLANIMGLITEEPLAYIEARQEKLLRQFGIDKKMVEDLIRERTRAREQKNWARGDEIRAELLGRHIELKDNAGSTTWRVRVNNQ